jgi:Ca2+-binding EF-hand superfamily protein
VSNKRNPVRPVQRPLTNDDIADLNEQFDECDADGDRLIDFGEFSQLLDRLGSQLSPAQCRSEFDSIDLDRDGTIDHGEFMAWWNQ